MIQWISQPIFEDERSFENSFIEPITRGEGHCWLLRCFICKYCYAVAPISVPAFLANYVVKLRDSSSCRPGRGRHGEGEAGDDGGAVHPARLYSALHPPQGRVGCCNCLPG